MKNSAAEIKLTLETVKVNHRMSEETVCFSATIYADGVKAGFVTNRGCGGSNEYQWLDQSLGRKIEDWANTQQTEYKFEKLDQIVDDLRTVAEVEKQLRGWMKKQTVFRLVGDKLGSWRTIASNSQQAVDYVTKTYGSKIEILLTPSNVHQVAGEEAAKETANARREIKEAANKPFEIKG